MSDFLFKGYSINQITDTTGSNLQAPGYLNSFPIAPTNYQYSRPLSFGYLYGNQQISDSTKAVSKHYYSPTNIDLLNDTPGASRYRVIMIGGGAGGGGYGGYAEAKQKNTFSTKNYKSSGGPGGNGGYGQYTYSPTAGYSISPSMTNTLNIIVGGGGGGGTNGNNDSNNVSGNGKTNAHGNAGNQGNPGGVSSLKITDQNVAFLSTSSANGGGGGGGGNAYANATNGSGSSTQGSPGTIGNLNNTDPINTGWDPSLFLDSGVGGAGGINNKTTISNANSGKGGCVQIIWLYE